MQIIKTHIKKLFFITFACLWSSWVFFPNRFAENNSEVFALFKRIIRSHWIIRGNICPQLSSNVPSAPSTTHASIFLYFFIEPFRIFPLQIHNLSFSREYIYKSAVSAFLLHCDISVATYCTVTICLPPSQSLSPSVWPR